MNKFCEIIYHPSRFVPPVCINILIYRYLNGVIDASKTEKSITLSLTIWGYPSRFSHYTLSDTKEATLRNVPQLVLYGIWEGQLQIWLSIKVTVSWYETFCSISWNTLFHPVKQADTCQSCDFRIARSFALLVNESGFFCIIISRKTWGITPNRDG